MKHFELERSLFDRDVSECFDKAVDSEQHDGGCSFDQRSLRRKPQSLQYVKRIAELSHPVPRNRLEACRVTPSTKARPAGLKRKTLFLMAVMAEVGQHGEQ